MDGNRRFFINLKNRQHWKNTPERRGTLNPLSLESSSSNHGIWAAVEGCTRESPECEGADCGRICEVEEDHGDVQEDLDEELVENVGRLRESLRDKQNWGLFRGSHHGEGSCGLGLGLHLDFQV